LKFEGVVWRHIPAGAHPLHVGYILHSSGRWNRSGLYGCLYTALTPEGARAEFERYLEKSSLRYAEIQPREIVSLRVSIDPVLDLTDKRNPYVNPKEQYLTGDESSDIERCRKLADAARSSGFLGLLVPSAGKAGEKNLVIYIDGPPVQLQLEVDGERIPILN
jgi:RES domain-containing protein